MEKNDISSSMISEYFHEFMIYSKMMAANRGYPLFSYIGEGKTKTYGTYWEDTTHYKDIKYRYIPVTEDMFDIKDHNIKFSTPLFIIVSKLFDPRNKFLLFIPIENLYLEKNNKKKFEHIFKKLFPNTCYDCNFVEQYFSEHERKMHNYKYLIQEGR